jgi:hypothetical protein
MLNDDWKLNHVGLVVRDWNIPMGYYQSTGMGVSVGPQVVTKDFAELNTGPSNNFFNREIPRINGGSGPGKPVDPESPGDRRPSTYTFMDKDCQVGDLLFEIIRDRTIPFEGITHLCYNVPDPKAETAKLTDKGCDIVLSFNLGETVLENYVDTRKYGHVIISFRPLVERWEKAWTAYNLSHPSVSDWKFQGMGIVVRDLDRTVDYYQFLDVGEFQEEGLLDSGSVEAIDGAGPDPGIRARTRSAQIGPVTFEFIQPFEGNAIFGESLDIRGEGVCNTCFTVANLEEEVGKLTQRRAPVSYSGKPRSGPAFAYFDTREYGGNIMVKLIQAE